MRLIILLSLCLAVAIAAPSNPQRIVGGSITSIDRYPYAAALLYSMSGSGIFSLSCGGAIINNRSILSAAHCLFGDEPFQWRARVGSTNAHSGGVIHTISRQILHPQYRHFTGKDNDIAILHVTSAFMFNNNVQPGRIPAHDYDLRDNQVVWAIGWGRTSFEGTLSEQLRHVQVWTVNQNICRNRYLRLLRIVTENMLCAGYLDGDGRGQCQGDSGGPLLHGTTIVGVCSFAYCGESRFPGVNVRVSRYTSWIQSNA